MRSVWIVLENEKLDFLKGAIDLGFYIHHG